MPTETRTFTADELAAEARGERKFGNITVAEILPACSHWVESARDIRCFICGAPVNMDPHGLLDRLSPTERARVEATALQQLKAEQEQAQRDRTNARH